MSHAASRQHAHTAEPSRMPPPVVKCRLCECKLLPKSRDDFTRELCAECVGRPEARRLSLVPTSTIPPVPNGGPRPFTPADKALIRSVNAYMPAPMLLTLLNDRLRADITVDGDVPLYTMEQLHQELRSAPPPASGAGDWGAMRRVLAQARKSGLLPRITPQVIQDFAVIFNLTPPQHMRLKDVLLNADTVASRGAAR